jgi:hypothetical protein
LGLLLGFSAAWIIRAFKIQHLHQEIRRNEGLLESERLIKETLRKESAMAFQLKETVEAELHKKIRELQIVIKMMDEDIILLQKSNEDTEALMQAGMPELHNLKVKLIEANNTIARLKAQLQQLQKAT